MSVRERCDCVVPELSPRDSVSRVTCLLVTTCSVFTERVSRPPGPRPVSWAQLGTLHIGDSWPLVLVLGWRGLTVSPTVITLVSLSPPSPAQRSPATRLLWDHNGNTMRNGPLKWPQGPEQ